MMVKELDLKLALGMTERRKIEPPLHEKFWGGGPQFESQSDPKSPSESGCPLSNRSQYRFGIAWTLNTEKIVVPDI